MDRRKEFSMTEHRRWRDQRQKMGGRRGKLSLSFHLCKMMERTT